MNKIPPDFNWLIYLKLNHDLNQNTSEIASKNHYINNGFIEKRKYKIDLPVNFDWKLYLKLNSDLNQDSSYKDIVFHYKNYGYFENRKYDLDIPENFDWKLYLKLNPDVNQDSTYEDTIFHYKNYGYFENRKYDNKKNVYHISHNFGGGTNVYIENMCKIFDNYNHILIYIIDDTNVLVNNNLINKMELQHIIKNEQLLVIHNLIFLENSKIKLCYKTLNLIKEIEIKKIFIVHDYFLFDPENPNPIKNTDKSLFLNKEKINEINNILSIFDKIFFNSKNCFDNFTKYLSNININNSHILNSVPDIFYYNKRIYPNKKNKYNIGILGDLTAIHKGSYLSEKIINFFDNHNAKYNFIIFGNSNFKKSNLIVTNEYKNKNIFKMINNYDIDFFIFLSTFEETYSFTLSIAINTGLPIIYNDIGSYSERLINYDNCYPFTENNYSIILNILTDIENSNNFIRSDKKIDIDYPNLYNYLPEFSNFLESKFDANEIEKKLENGNICFIHFYNINDESIEIFNDQINYIKKSGLYDKLDFIFVILIGKNFLFNDYKIKLLYYKENNFENNFYAIEFIKKFTDSISKNIKILYLHTQKFINNTFSFRKYIEYFLIEKYNLCLTGLNSYKCVGVNPQFCYDNNNNNNNNNKNYFSGNFWWSNSNYIKTLNYLDNININKEDTYFDYNWLIGNLEKNDYRNFLYLNNAKNSSYDNEYNLEIIKTKITNNLNTNYIKKRKIYAVYFICCLGNYLNIINEQINKLFASGLYDITDEIFCFVCLEKLDCIHLLKKYKKITIISSNENLFEKFALNNFKKYVSGDYYLYYMHTKSITRTENIFNDWRILCEYFTIEKWRIAVEFLEYYDCYGTLLKNFPKKHFSGNFWWSKSEHINTLKDINDGYLSCEMYICSNIKTNYVSIYESDFNISYNSYPISIYNVISDYNLVNNYSIIPDFNVWDIKCINLCGDIDKNDEPPIIEK